MSEFSSPPSTGIGSGDMVKATYDPQDIGEDAFDTDNHTDGTTNKVFTAVEKTKLAGISGTNTGDQTSIVGITGTLAEFNTAISDGNIPVVSDTAYDATSWNGNTDAPTKNAIRDKIESMGGGGSSAWGGITGTLSDQTDLQAALDAKADETISLGTPITGTAGSPVAGDNGKVIHATNADPKVITMLATATLGVGWIAQFYNEGAGAMTFVGDTGVTFSGYTGPVPQGHSVTVRNDDTDHYVISYPAIVQLTTDQLAAITSADSPTAGNPFATMADVGGGGLVGNTLEIAAVGDYVAVPYGTAGENLIPSTGIVYYAPVYISGAVDIDRVAVRLEATTAPGGSTVELGLYTNTDGRPDELIESYGTVAADAPGVVEATVDTDITPGWCWIAILPVFASGSMTLTAVNDNMRSPTTSANDAFTNFASLRQTGQATLPATAAPNTDGGFAPTVAFRIA